MPKSWESLWRNTSRWRRIIVRWLYPEIFSLFKQLASIEKHEAEMRCRTQGLAQSIQQKNEVIKRLSRENHEYRELSEKDPKTKLLNTRGLERQFLNAFDIARRSEINQEITVVAFIVIDLDNFKRLNDELGHDCGDTALLVITELIQLCFPRKTDPKCRWGGDEFVVVLFDSDEKQSSLSAERFRRDVESDPRLHFEASSGEKIHITASIGVTTRAVSIEEHGVLDTLLSAEIGRTDAALREAKQGGKNQICLMKNDI